MWAKLYWEFTCSIFAVCVYVCDWTRFVTIVLIKQGISIYFLFIYMSVQYLTVMKGTAQSRALAITHSSICSWLHSARWRCKVRGVKNKDCGLMLISYCCLSTDHWDFLWTFPKSLYGIVKLCSSSSACSVHQTARSEPQWSDSSSHRLYLKMCWENISKGTSTNHFAYLCSLTYLYAGIERH